MLKQTIVFVFDFKDVKSIFKSVIHRFKQLELDLKDNILLTYNTILASMYQDEDLLRAIAHNGPIMDEAEPESQRLQNDSMPLIRQ